MITSVEQALERLLEQWDHRRLVYANLKQIPQGERPCHVAAMPTLLWPLRGQLRYGMATGDGDWRFQILKASDLLFVNVGDWSIRDSDRDFCLIKIEWQTQATLVTVNDNGEKYFFEKPPVEAHVINDLINQDVMMTSALSAVRLKSALGRALTDMMSRQVVSSSKAQRSFLSCCEHLREHLHEDIDRRSVAAAVGIHPGHVSRLFKQFHPGGYDGWLRLERVRRARQLLHDPHISVAEVARLCGISNVSWFIRCFKAETGMTPAVYRGQYANSL